MLATIDFFLLLQVKTQVSNFTSQELHIVMNLNLLSFQDLLTHRKDMFVQQFDAYYYCIPNGSSDILSSTLKGAKMF